MADDARTEERPASRTGAILALLTLILGVPLACLGAFALYGKYMSESEVAVGKLLSPEEARVQREEAMRVFREMTTAQHLEKARQMMANGYDPQTRSGGHLGTASRHLEAVPEGSPERAEATRLLAEIAERKRQIWVYGSTIVRSTLREGLPSAGQDDDDLEELRVTVAQHVDRLSPRGLGCVHAVGDKHRVFQFEGDCSPERIDLITPPDVRPDLRRAGFRRVQCLRTSTGFDL